MSDVQDPSPWTVLSNIGGMLSIGGVILSALFGLGYAALLGMFWRKCRICLINKTFLGLEDFSLFPSSSQSTQAAGDGEGEKGHTGASAPDPNGGGGGELEGTSGVRQRNGHDTEDENTVLLLPLGSHKTT
ncbi:hypothetical protein BOTBODRAFT_39750 [Botryobasidium botryosum FD-172 SS1]|uniref:Uncharacterized protein n=1 Tax=Botryobasidium botryosum (strain FD-172 SS1) TaxID=930990 RepID=A0A067M3R7_BOTB1|nr:hypothetical protein BOTBODRAFT_39750 [Botryobasidium botryosum FD-172 SS1]